MKIISMKTFSILLIASILATFIFTNPSFAAEEEENCLLCHKYKGLRIIDKENSVRNFYVDKEHYNASTHKEARCRGCHTSITQVPHKNADHRIHCGIRCHLKTKSLVKKYKSHSNIYVEFNLSSHGKPSKETPDCLYCHSRNLKKAEIKMSRLETLAECVSCHLDDVKMKEYDIPAGIVEGYMNSNHAKVFFVEQTAGAICTDCHSTHNISPKEVEKSPMHPKNIKYTCAGSADRTKDQLDGCHIATNPDFMYAFDHELNKEAGVTTSIQISNIVNFIIVILFYLLCMVNIIRTFRE